MEPHIVRDYDTTATPVANTQAPFGPSWGLHPMAAGGMICLDWMLFTGLELPSGFLLTFVSFFVGMAFAVPVALLQRYTSKDDWGTAIAKAFTVGILTAVPSPLPDFAIAAWGIAGWRQLARRRVIESSDNNHHYGDN